MSDLSIIIVNWNTKDTLLNCLGSLPNNYEIIVIDNGSNDGSVSAVKEKHPNIAIIQNDYNTGFAHAVNQGIKKATGKYILSLNSDSQVTPDTLKEMIKFMDENSSVGIAGAQLIKEDGSLQNSFDNFPNFISTLFNKSVLRILFPDRYPSKNTKDKNPTPFTVESVIGACMIIRPEALKKTGLLDEDYFVFLEETDLCLKMRKAGWKVMVIPKAKVLHLQGETKKQALMPSKTEYLKSLYAFLRKNNSPLAYLLIRTLYPVKLFFQFLFAGIGFLLTLGLAPKIRSKCYGYAYLLLWHLMLCTQRMTLKGLSERIKNAYDYSIINWAYKDRHIDTKELPVKINKEHMVKDEGFESATIKESKLKKLLKVKSPSGNKYLVKMYKDIHPFCWLKNMAKGDKAIRELNIARKISYLGINTVVPIAIGYNKKLPWIPKYSIVVTKELENCCGLNIYLSKPELVPHLPYNQTIRRKAIKAWGQLAGKIHSKGILQDDFDPNNILIQFDKNSSDFNLFLVDFERINFYNKLSLNQQIHSLAKLNRFQVKVNNQDRITFFKAYLNKDHKTMIKTWIKEIKQTQDKIKLKDYAWAKKVSLLPSRHVGFYNTKSYSVFYRKKYPAALREGFKPNDISSIIQQTDSGNIPSNLKVKEFPSYKEAKHTWQELNALLRVYTVSALPVALIKNRIKNKGVLVFEPIQLNRYISNFFKNDLIQERLTELINLGIK